MKYLIKSQFSRRKKIFLVVYRDRKSTLLCVGKKIKSGNLVVWIEYLHTDITSTYTLGEYSFHSYILLNQQYQM